jgi:tetratricopeptide (TPR) repeat protein
MEPATRRVSRFVVMAAVLAGGAAAAGEPSPAVIHYEAGLRHYNVQEYEDAIAEFKVAYKIDPRPEFLFNLAQAERLSGRCKQAIVGYETFLRGGDVPVEFTRMARAHIERCRAQVEADERAAEARARAMSLNTLTMQLNQRPPIPVYKRKWFWGVMGGAAAVVITAVTVGVVVGTRDNSTLLAPLKF